MTTTVKDVQVNINNILEVHDAWRTALRDAKMSKDERATLYIQTQLNAFEQQQFGVNLQDRPAVAAKKKSR